jgi:hypothetical protein
MIKVLWRGKGPMLVTQCNSLLLTFQCVVAKSNSHPSGIKPSKKANNTLLSYFWVDNGSVKLTGFAYFFLRNPPGM